MHGYGGLSSLARSPCVPDPRKLYVSTKWETFPRNQALPNVRFAANTGHSRTDKRLCEVYPSPNSLQQFLLYSIAKR